MTRRLLLLLCLLASVRPLLARDRVVTLLHFSDYHSHARPFYSEERQSQGGISRAIGYLERERARPATFVFSGGDMMNAGSPAWSDRYRCVEWAWFNGIVDAMAFGNHDADYGPETFASCRGSVTYPILGANVVDAAGKPLFEAGGKPYLVLRSGKLRIGVFAVAGDDFERLVTAQKRPATGARFLDRTESARRVVAELRGKEKVDAVVLIGHAHRDDDVALARAVSGIDLVFGTHSHIKEELHRIDGTSTWFISPYQYLTYVSRVQLHFHGRKLVKVDGGLVRVDGSLPSSAAVEAKVAQLQSQLEADPQYAELFRRIGSVAAPMSLENQLEAETPLGNFVMDVVRSAAGADVAISTTSSFRQPFAPGDLLMEELRGTLPYPNKILVYRLTGGQLRKLLEAGMALRGSDAFPQLSGVRLVVDGGRLASVSVGSGDRFLPLDDAASYAVATTDYLALVSTKYRDFFSGLDRRDTGLEVRDEVRKYVEAHSPVSSSTDGRIQIVRPGG